MENLEKKINYTFQNRELLETALTHSSYTKDRGMARDKCNERLEFLGDAILEAVICEQLFIRIPKAEEGKMTKIKSNIVRATALAELARELELGQYLRLGNSEIIMGGKDKEGILADAMESVIAAVYVDAGFETAKEMILGLFEEQIQRGLDGKLYSDFKSGFQEKVQADGIHRIEYKIVREEGKSHDKTFYVHLTLDGEVVGEGTGKNKKSAENEAAKIALMNWKRKDI